MQRESSTEEERSLLVGQKYSITNDTGNGEPPKESDSPVTLVLLFTVFVMLCGNFTYGCALVVDSVSCHKLYLNYVSCHVNFLTDPQAGSSTLRPADVLVYGWIGGHHACVDLTGVSPLVGLGSGVFTAGQAALKAASAKVTKHEKTCTDNQHAFIPFAFDTFGFLAPDAVELLKRVQKVMHSNVMTPRSRNVVFKRIGFAIQKGLAAQFVARLPSISM